MTTGTRDDDAARIREIIEERVTALAVKDPAPLTSRYASDVVLFDAVGPLRHVGSDAQATRVEEWFASYRGGIDYEIRDLDVVVAGDAAFCHYLYRVAGTMTDETQVAMWVRSTVGLRKIDGSWTITHEHSSVPFDGATGYASVDLLP